jgi:hypothetical protein
MSRTVPSRQQPLVQTARPPTVSTISRRPLQKSELWIELTRRLALHLVSLSASLTGDGNQKCAPTSPIRPRSSSSRISPGR